jgi:hypothetical protein
VRFGDAASLVAAAASLKGDAAVRSPMFDTSALAGRRTTDDDSRMQRKGGDFCAMNCPAALPVSFRLTLSEQRDRLYLPPAADLRLLTGNK